LQLLTLNELAWQLCDTLAADAERLNIVVSQNESGARIIDCGVKAAGGLEAGRRLAEICLAGCGRVTLTANGDHLSIQVQSDVPLLACMASQYAGWQITGEKFFGMGSGPMRAAAAREPLFAELGIQEKPSRVVGILETAKLPTVEVCQRIAADCGVTAANLTLLAARTASIAGSLQVTARSLETALHKLHATGYDLKKIVSGFGSAPLLPIAADDMAAIGRTNDSILYGGSVTLFVHDDDQRLSEIGPRIPSLASHDFGEPFAAIFARYDRDFYKIDPLLFSPARITFNNLKSGNSFTFGELRPDILERSLTA
jgi:methenyltetrahydromethanopterin cyclohydrolase